MKTIKSLFATALVLFCMNDSVKASNGSSELARSMSEKVKSSVKTPEVLKESHKSLRIPVTFAVNEDGRVIEVFADTDNQNVKKDLENQFLQMNFKGLTPCATNSVDIHFVNY